MTMNVTPHYTRQWKHHPIAQVYRSARSIAKSMGTVYPLQEIFIHMFQFKYRCSMLHDVPNSSFWFNSSYILQFCADMEYF